MKIINIAAYRFVDLENPQEWREAIYAICLKHQLKGTVLVGHEGLNIMLAGPRMGIDAFHAWLSEQAEFSGIEFKESESGFVPFSKLKVKVKKEIIAMHLENVRPLEKTAPHLPAKELKKWFDEERDFVLLDTRNRYEIEAGTFTGAMDLGIDTFREFPQAVTTKLADEHKDKIIVTVCTGGIRCEKAAIALHREGFKNVFQLDGGIIKYFEECEGAHYDGNCVVFDDRVAVTPQLDVIQR